MQELWFLCMTRCLNLLYKCMKFRLNIFGDYQVIELTRSCDGQTHANRCKGKDMHARDMVLVHFTSSKCALQMY